ncbi:MAG: hypothetical protein IKP21_04695 [Bacteroidales bacterium]|nr:hypothetical protein [Bacteroidales bacterium]
MVNLFRKNTVVQVLLILAATLLLWGRSLVYPPAMADGDAVLYHLLYLGISSLPRLAVVIALLLVLAEGVWLNLLLANVGLVPQTTLLPTLLYIILMSAPATTLTPAIFVGGIMIAITHQLMLRTTLLTITTDKICSATALIGLASMFYLPSLALILSYLLVVINYRLYSWRDWLSMLLGLAAPYIMLLTVLYLTGNLTIWLSGTYYSLGGISLQSDTEKALAIGGNLVLVLVFLVGLFALWGHLGEHPIVWQKNATTVMLLSVGSAAMLLYSRVFPVDMRLFAVPFTLCGLHLLMPEKSHSYGHRKQRTWILDIVLLLTFIAALVC